MRTRVERMNQSSKKVHQRRRATSDSDDGENSNGQRRKKEERESNSIERRSNAREGFEGSGSGWVIKYDSGSIVFLLCDTHAHGPIDGRKEERASLGVEDPHHEGW